MTATASEIKAAYDLIYENEKGLAVDLLDAFDTFSEKVLETKMLLPDNSVSPLAQLISQFTNATLGINMNREYINNFYGIVSPTVVE